MLTIIQVANAAAERAEADAILAKAQHTRLSKAEEEIVERYMLSSPESEMRRVAKQFNESEHGGLAVDAKMERTD